MKRETLVMNSDFIGKAIYEGQEAGPSQIDGVKGNFVKHKLYSEKHGLFDVITKATSKVYPAGSWVEVIDPLFYPDNTVNGINLQPAFNVLAKGLKVINN